MQAPVRRLFRRILEGLGLIGPYYRWRERRLARQTARLHDDGRPMPPPELMVAVSGGANQAEFSERGQADAVAFLQAARRWGLAADEPIRVLDFGCGCGRIARWMAPDVVERGGAFLGSDLNRTLIAWCAANLPGNYRVNGLLPPLDLPDGGLDLVYAHSVLTHLAEATAKAWLTEIARVLRAGGLALVTFHDEAYAERWGPPQVAARLAQAGYLVWNNALEGSNYMSAWTTRAAFAALSAPWFEVLEIEPGGSEVPTQALAILKART